MSDIHLSLKPPVARSVEEDWLQTQADYLKQLDEIAREVQTVIIAGDLFDKPSPPVELVNFAMKYLPNANIYAVPGQHDLVHHSYKDISKSAYWTLVEARAITNIPPGVPIEVPGKYPIRLHGFPWGFDPQPLRDPHDLFYEIAVIHKYMWSSRENCYKDAPIEGYLANTKKQLRGYDVVVVGDNHQHWSHRLQDGQSYWNGGGFMRRKADEMDYNPCVGILLSDGTIERKYLDVSGDKFLSTESLPEVMKGIGFETFLESLAELGDAAISFSDAIHRTLEREKVPAAVKALILSILEGAGR